MRVCAIRGRKHIEQASITCTACAGEGPELWSLFKDTFGLQWKSGGYRRMEHHLQHVPTFGASLDQLPKTFSVKSTWLKDVPAHEAMYTSAQDECERSACAVAVCACGEGRLIYFGDVNGEVHSLRVLRTLLQERL